MKIPKFISLGLAKSYICKKPLWFMWNPKLHKIKGFEIRKIIDSMKEGDIILRRFNGYLNTIFTPGFWSHAALVISNKTVIHALASGVVKEDIIDYCRTDNICLIRRKNITDEEIEKIIRIANGMIIDNIQYDFDFSDNNGKVYCTEFINIVNDEIYRDDYKIIMGNNILLPDDLKNSIYNETIIEIKNK